MRAIDFLVEHQRLDEVNMSPSSLKMLVKSIGATAGMEFEMIVPNVDNPSDAEYEPDYDSDERSSSFGHIEDFFMGGDGNNSRRDVRSMIERLQEQFWEWQSEQQDDEWSNESRDYVKDYVVNNGEFDEDEAIEKALEELSEKNPEVSPEDHVVRHRVRELLDEFVEEILEEGYGNRIYDRAYEEFRDNHDGYDEGDWLWDNYKYMTDVYNEFGDGDVYWPYTRQVGGDEDIENVAESFSDAIGRPCNASSDYHGVRKQGEYTVEPDGSLDPDSSDDTGLEFVSPPLPLTELIADLTDVVMWADSYGCYTNDSTGLHMNVSVPSFSNDKLDYVKLAILLGDEYVLKQFGRQANNYCKSGMQKVMSNIGNADTEKVKNLLELMKQGLAKEASDLIHSGLTDKYTSINTKSGYVEFRSPGGDWLNEDTEKLTNTLYRFVVALDAACDPNKYKEEYYKKLYKLLSAGQDDTYGKMINDFAMYTTGVGGAPQKVVADFRRLALATLKQSQGKESGSWWWNVAINGQRIEVVADNPDDAWQSAITANREWSRFSKRNAKIERLRPFSDDTLTNKSNIQGKMQDGGIYKIFDTRGTLIAGDEYGSDQEALERAKYWAQQRSTDVVVKNQQGQEVGRVTSSGTVINTNYQAQDEQPPTNQGNWGIWVGGANRFAREPGEYPAGQEVPLRRFASQEDAELFLQRTRDENPRMRSDVEVRQIEPEQGQQDTQEPNFYIVDGNRNVIVNRYYAPDVNNSYQYFLRWKQQNDPQETGNYRYGRLSHDTEARYRELAATQPVRQTAAQPTGQMYEIYRMDTHQPVRQFQARSEEEAREQLENYRANVPSQLYHQLIVRAAQ